VRKRSLQLSDFQQWPGGLHRNAESLGRCDEKPLPSAERLAGILQSDSGEAVFNDAVGALQRAELLAKFVDLSRLQAFECRDNDTGAFFNFFS